MSVGVLIAVRGDKEEPVAATVGAAPGLRVARRCADLGEALATAQAGLGQVVLVSEQPQLNRAVVAQFAAAGVRAIGVPDGPAEAKRLAGIGVAQSVAADASPQEVASIVEKVLAEATAAALALAESRPEPRVQMRVGTRAEYVPGVGAALPQAPAAAGPRRPGSIVAVWGPAGAPGRTTVAVNLAHELAATCDVILVDVDTYGGAVAQALGLMDEAPGIAALARAALNGTLTPDSLGRHATRIGPNLRVLTGLSRPERWPELTPAALEPVWELLRTDASVVVVDCGFGLERDEELQYDTKAPQRNGATMSALLAADAVVAVGSAEPLAMERLVHGLTTLGELCPSETTPRLVVVNRVRSSVAGLQPREAVADALRRFAGVDQVWTVPWDPRGCDAATLAGQALGERSPRASARRAIQGLALGVLAAVGRGEPRAIDQLKARLRAAAQPLTAGVTLGA